MRKWGVFVLDLVIVAASSFVGIAVRSNFEPTGQQIHNILPYAGIGVAVAFTCFSIVGVHRGISRYVSLPDLSRIITVVTISLMITLLIEFYLNRLEFVARSLPLIQWVFIIAAMLSLRLGGRMWFRRRVSDAHSLAVAHKEHVLVVGVNHVAELYLRCAADLARDKISVVGILDESPQLKGRLLRNHKVLGSPSELTQILGLLNVHGIDINRLIVTMPFSELSQDSRDILLRYESGDTIKLDLFEEKLGFGLPKSTGAEALAKEGQGDKVAPLTLQDVGIESWGGGYAFFKRVTDALGSLILLVIFLPLIVLVCLIVALDVGLPVIFWQQRPGKGGRPFKLYKFRTMGQGHDARGRRIADNERLSSIGRFLRRTRLDELPQLYNILVGEMSFIGPRPLLPIDQPDGIEPRFSIRPGLSGWAQVNGGKTVSPQDKAVLDIWYIRHASLWLDLTIALRTVVMMVRGERLNADALRGAYAVVGLTWPGESAQQESGEQEDGLSFPNKQEVS